ncbi:ATP-binding cassette domain-containing protein [Oceanobacillus kapialis]|uniref:ATP-binding cassette domain-containing protein n=1 Tax=Oceanobacillus kapialis TaxID=481353 RepID=A0ABW5PYZ1_9BACI
MIELTGVNFKIGKQTIINNISLNIKVQECVAITGENGSGKSVLLKLIAGLASPTKGMVRNSFTHRGYAPETPPKSLHFTAQEYLMYMGKIAGMNKHQLEKRIYTLFNQFDFDFQQDYIHKLSKGNKQKINLMQSLLKEPFVLILDEPLSGLDPQSQENFVKYLKELKDKGTTIIFTCHEELLKDSLADRILIVEDKRIKEGQLSHKVLYRSIQFSGDHTKLFPVIKKSAGVETVTRLPNGSYEVIVKAEYSDIILLEILKMGGKIEFLSTRLTEKNTQTEGQEVL